MKLIFKETTYELPEVTIEEIIQKINDILENKYYFSHLNINGIEVTEEPELYLENYLTQLETVEIIAIPAKKFINELLLSTDEYLSRAIPVLKTTAEHFYDVAQVSHWYDIHDLLGAIQWLFAMTDTVGGSDERPANWRQMEEEVNKLSDVIKEFEEALENKDQVLIADLLTYEILPIFEDMSAVITHEMDKDGENGNIN